MVRARKKLTVRARKKLKFEVVVLLSDVLRRNYLLQGVRKFFSLCYMECFRKDSKVQYLEEVCVNGRVSSSK
jgi:hypothetical protein